MNAAILSSTCFVLCALLLRAVLQLQFLTSLLGWLRRYGGNLGRIPKHSIFALVCGTVLNPNSLPISKAVCLLVPGSWSRKRQTLSVSLSSSLSSTQRIAPGYTVQFTQPHLQQPRQTPDFLPIHCSPTVHLPWVFEEPYSKGISILRTGKDPSFGVEKTV